MKLISSLRAWIASHHLSLGVWVLVLLFSCMAASFFVPALRLSHPIPATAEAAKLSLKLMKDWAVWMAGIQSATLAAVGLMAKEFDLGKAFCSRPYLRTLAAGSAFFNAVALLFSAWLLTSLSSMMLRVMSEAPYHGATSLAVLSQCFDIYERALYAWGSGDNCTQDYRLRLGWIVFWNHILWGAGIFAFASFCVGALPRHEVTAGAGGKPSMSLDKK